MPASDPYQIHDVAVLTAIMLAGPAALIGLVIYLCSSLMRFRRHSLCTAYRDLCLSSLAASLALYLWGCAHVVFRERQEVGSECAKAAGAGARRVEAFHGDFVPLQLVCRTEGGGTYTVLIPDYINPSIVVTSSLALAFGIAAFLLHRRQLVSDGAGKEGKPC
ncbi:hypothetical protein ACMA1D_14455 [Streptomyces sp. 796.1]|uniref:hypothetical protein n=1 Tax=Streptomyces sp. 796.1 TaxID=3163029 RepID=UPI0039C9E78D